MMTINTNKLIVILSRNKRISALMMALGNQRTRTVVVKSAGISLVGPPPKGADLERALRSATKVPKTRWMKHLKRWVLRAQYAWAYNFLSKHEPSTVMCWNGMKGYRLLFMLAARELGHRTVFLEESPLPNRISVDYKGINYGNSLPRNRDFFTSWAKSNPQEAGRWKKLRDEMAPRQPSIVRTEEPAALALDNARFIFCPLQVPGDSQLTIYGDWCETVEKTVIALHTASPYLPDGYHFRLKEHPSSKKRLTSWIKELETDKFQLDNASDTFELIKKSTGVVTVNSSVGLEALFLDRPVITLGHAFYAVDGIAAKASSPPEIAAWVNSILTSEFDTLAKNALLDYLAQVHFPTEEAVLSGEFGLDTLSARDNEAARRLSELGFTLGAAENNYI